MAIFLHFICYVCDTADYVPDKQTRWSVVNCPVYVSCHYNNGYLECLTSMGPKHVHIL